MAYLVRETMVGGSQVVETVFEGSFAAAGLVADETPKLGNSVKTIEVRSLTDQELADWKAGKPCTGQ